MKSALKVKARRVWRHLDDADQRKTQSESHTSLSCLLGMCAAIFLPSASTINCLLQGINPDRVRDLVHFCCWTNFDRGLHIRQYDHHESHTAEWKRLHDAQRNITLFCFVNPKWKAVVNKVLSNGCDTQLDRTSANAQKQRKNIWLCCYAVALSHFH